MGIGDGSWIGSTNGSKEGAMVGEVFDVTVGVSERTIVGITDG